MNKIPFKQNQEDGIIAIESAEDFFNENTRDFTIHEELTQVVSNQRQIPDLKTNTQLHEELPVNTQNEPTLPIEIQTEKEEKTFQFKFQFPKLNKTFVLASLGSLLVIITVYGFLNKTRPAPVSINNNTWEMNLSRPFVELSPEYKDWTYVENQFLKPESSEKN